MPGVGVPVGAVSMPVGTHVGIRGYAQGVTGTRRVWALRVMCVTTCMWCAWVMRVGVMCMHACALAQLFSI